MCVLYVVYVFIFCVCGLQQACIRSSSGPTQCAHGRCSKFKYAPKVCCVHLNTSAIYFFRWYSSSHGIHPHMVLVRSHGHDPASPRVVRRGGGGIDLTALSYNSLIKHGPAVRTRLHGDAKARIRRCPRRWPRSGWSWSRASSLARRCSPSSSGMGTSRSSSPCLPSRATLPVNS